ncbi:type II toxin-antitoxin system RelE family toxin [Halalkalibacter oceani]|uniref:type II toxin-antitoxin system RelE family toxin n=1 Tax=Halalkalibacter oceani TaxID=1653776 RepID=UPI0033930305
MKSERRFLLQFIDANALKEYRKLDGSVKKLVDIALKKLEARANEIGKPLERKLKGCKEIKFRKNGIRIIFRIVKGQ